MSRATAARSPARVPSTSAAGSRAAGVTSGYLNGFDGGDAGDAVLQDPLHPALEGEPGDRAAVTRPRELHLHHPVLRAYVLDVAAVHLEGGADGVDRLEDGGFHQDLRSRDWRLGLGPP